MKSRKVRFKFIPVKQLITKNTFQVLANYTVYDFEDIISQVQSFSYRQLSIRDSTKYNFNKEFSLNLSGELRFYEQGQFNNKNFSVKPIAFFIEQFYIPKLSYLYNSLIEFSIGYKFFEQNRYQYENTIRQLVNNFKTFGPVGEINLYLNNNSIINLTGSMDFIKYSNPPQSNSAFSMQINVLWNM